MNDRFERLREILSEENPEALLADGFEDAFLGPLRRPGSKTIAAYSYSKALRVLKKRDGLGEEEGREYLDFNVVSAWMGPDTPAWVFDLDDEGEGDFG